MKKLKVVEKLQICKLGSVHFRYIIHPKKLQILQDKGPKFPWGSKLEAFMVTFYFYLFMFFFSFFFFFCTGGLWDRQRDTLADLLRSRHGNAKVRTLHPPRGIYRHIHGTRHRPQHVLEQPKFCAASWQKRRCVINMRATFYPGFIIICSQMFGQKKKGTVFPYVLIGKKCDEWKNLIHRIFLTLLSLVFCLLQKSESCLQHWLSVHLELKRSKFWEAWCRLGVNPIQSWDDSDTMCLMNVQISQKTWVQFRGQ